MAQPSMELDNGDRVAVVGGGPAGAFSAYFLLEMADRADISLHVDIFEPKDFLRQGPAGCNHCGGIVSESLVQMLASEGIILPDTVVRRGIEAYELHSGPRSVRILTPLKEKRIAAIYRGGGPRSGKGPDSTTAANHWQSFDDYLLNLAREKGARVLGEKVTSLDRTEAGVSLRTTTREHEPYALVVGAVGVNAKSQELFKPLGLRFKEPRTTRTVIGELRLGADGVDKTFGHAMHVFLQDLPGVEFAAMIPKGDYVTMCLVGHDLDNDTVKRFLESEEVRGLLARGGYDPDQALERVCGCKPLMNIGLRGRPYADRVALVGDCGVTRLYKDGIGAAYRTAKSLAVAAMFQGVSRRDFDHSYWPALRALKRDNRMGGLIFHYVHWMKRIPFERRAVLAMSAAEQTRPANKRIMSGIMWDTFTGSAPYADIFLRAVRPGFLAGLGWRSVASIFHR